MVNSHIINARYVALLFVSVGLLESTAAIKLWVPWKSAPEVSGNPPTQITPVESSLPGDLPHSMSSSSATNVERFIRYNSFAGKCSQLYLLAYTVNKINSPKESYNDMKILYAMVEQNAGGSSFNKRDLWNKIYGRMIDNIQEVEHLEAQLQHITRLVERDKICEVSLSDEEFETHIDELENAYEGPFTAIVNQLARDGWMNVQRTMLKCLSMSMLNDEKITNLVTTLTEGHAEASGKRNIVLSKMDFANKLQRIDMDVNEFKKWVTVRRSNFKVYTQRIERVAILFASTIPKGLVLEHYRLSEKCVAQWYKIHLGLQEKEEFIRDVEYLSAKIKYAISKRGQSPNAVRVFGKVIKVVLDTLPYRLGDREVKNPMLKDIEELNGCIHTLESNRDDENISVQIDLELGDEFEMATGFSLGSDSEVLLSTGYLFELLRNMEGATNVISTWIAEFEKLATTEGSSGTSAYAPDIQRTKVFAKSIRDLVDDAKTLFRHIKHRTYLDVSMGRASAAGESSRDSENAKLKNIMDKIYINLYSARLLFMEFYDKIFYMRKYINIQIRLFKGYDIVDEAKNLINMALPVLEENLDEYLGFRKEGIIYLSKLAAVEKLMHYVDGDAIMSHLPALNLNKEDVHTLVDEFNLTNNTRLSIRQLANSFKELNDMSLMKDVEEALASFFKLRSVLHKSLLLNKSIHFINHLKTFIGDDIKTLDEMKRRAWIFILKSLEHSGQRDLLNDSNKIYQLIHLSESRSPFYNAPDSQIEADRYTAVSHEGSYKEIIHASAKMGINGNLADVPMAPVDYMTLNDDNDGALDSGSLHGTEEIASNHLNTRDEPSLMLGLIEGTGAEGGHISDKIVHHPLLNSSEKSEETSEYKPTTGPIRGAWDYHPPDIFNPTTPSPEGLDKTYGSAPSIVASDIMPLECINNICNNPPNVNSAMLTSAVSTPHNSASDTTAGNTNYKPNDNQSLLQNSVLSSSERHETFSKFLKEFIKAYSVLMESPSQSSSPSEGLYTCSNNCSTDDRENILYRSKDILSQLRLIYEAWVAFTETLEKKERELALRVKATRRNQLRCVSSDDESISQLLHEIEQVFNYRLKLQQEVISMSECLTLLSEDVKCCFSPGNEYFQQRLREQMNEFFPSLISLAVDMLDPYMNSPSVDFSNSLKAFLSRFS